MPGVRDAIADAKEPAQGQVVIAIDSGIVLSLWRVQDPSSEQVKDVRPFSSPRAPGVFAPPSKDPNPP